MKKRNALLVSIALWFSFFAQAQTSKPLRTDDDKKAYKSAMEEADQRIYGEVKAHSELMKNLEYLTSNIGARLTGSKQMQQASEWTLKRFKDYGVDAHLETTQIAHAYYRGADAAELTAPISRRVPIHAMGWSRATPGEVSGSVVALKIENPDDLARYKGKLKGAVILEQTHRAFHA